MHIGIGFFIGVAMHVASGGGGSTPVVFDSTFDGSFN
jgi:hypothetical protein